MAMLNVDVPDDMRAALKRYAFDKRITMRLAVQQALAAMLGVAAPQAGETVGESPASEPGAPADIGGDTRPAPMQGVSFED